MMHGVVKPCPPNAATSLAGLPTVGVLSTGGTIAMASGDAHGAVPVFDAAALVDAVPPLAEVAHIRARSVLRRPGASLGLEDVDLMLAAAESAVDDGAAGVVVTQGTDSLEEVAFALDLAWGRDAPLVVTGAMRPADQPGADGPANLLAAVRVAAADQARGLGVVVVLGDEIHSARRVAKLDAAAPQAFGSPASGPLGRVAERRVHLHFRPAASSSLTRLGVRAGGAAGARVPRVALITVAMGDRGELLDAARSAGLDGVVLAAMGGGHVPEGMLPAISRLVAEAPVVLASRTGAGHVLHETYGFPGSERDLLGLGLLDAGDLAPLKARVLLLTLLRSGSVRSEVEQAFRRVASQDP